MVASCRPRSECSRSAEAHPGCVAMMAEGASAAPCWEMRIKMSRVLSVVVLVSLLVFAGAALAMDKPTINTPAAGASLGTNYDISGSMPYKALLVVMTDCVRTDTGEVLGSVPGIRHWTNANGSFQFRCASPRIFIGEDIPLIYRVRCFEVNRSGETGPEAVVECNKAK